MSELFLKIFNTAIMAGWLVLAVLLVRLPLKKAPAWVKCTLWAIVGLRLVWPFEIESVLSLVPSVQTLPPSQLYAYTPQVHTGIHALNSAVNPVFGETFAATPANSVNPLQVVTAVAAWVWIAGMLVMAGYAAVSYLRLRRRVAVSMPAGEGVYLCDHVASPFILGIFKPKIYLPSDLPEEKWDMILSHERAHLARRDHWWKPLGFVLLTVFWFHPLLWFAYILLCRDVELACDEKVIRTLSAGEKQDYSQTLLECSVPKKWITACPLAFGETGVKQRVKAILHYKKPALWILIAALLVCAVLAVCFLTEPADTTYSLTAADVAGTAYAYEGEGCGGAFTVHIQDDGSFSYYEGKLSSYIGLGQWEVKDDKLYLYDGETSAGMTFVFSAESDGLVFLAEESDRFIYVDVPDGGKFYRLNVSTAADSMRQPLFLRVEASEEDFFIGLDVDGSRWSVEGSAGEHSYVWITYDGQPQVVQEATADSPASYRVKASDVWFDKEYAAGRYKTALDVCRFDIDGDGVREELFLTFGPTSGFLTFTLGMCDPLAAQELVTFYSFTGINAAAFSVENDRLTILVPAYSYPDDHWSMRVYDVTWADGNVIISENGIPLQTLKL